MKTCSACKTEKPAEAFSKGQIYCRPCASAKFREWVAKADPLPEVDPRHGTLSGYNNHRCRCRPCKDAAAAASKAARRRRPPVVCGVCGRSFAARGIKAHRATHERREPRQPARDVSTVAVEAPWGPDPSTWRRPGPSVQVLEVVEELTDAEVEALLAGFRPLPRGEATASEMARLDLMFGAKGGQR